MFRWISRDHWSVQEALGYVHTWCTSTSAWTPVPNGAVFTHGVSMISTSLKCQGTRSGPCTRARPWCQSSGVGTWENGVFTLVLSNNRTRAPCSGTKCGHSLTVRPLRVWPSPRINSHKCCRLTVDQTSSGAGAAVTNIWFMYSEGNARFRWKTLFLGGLKTQEDLQECSTTHCSRNISTKDVGTNAMVL